MASFSMTKAKFTKMKEVIKNNVDDVNLQIDIIERIKQATGFPDDNEPWPYQKGDKEALKRKKAEYLQRKKKEKLLLAQQEKQIDPPCDTNT